MEEPETQRHFSQQPQNKLYGVRANCKVNDMMDTTKFPTLSTEKNDFPGSTSMEMDEDVSLLRQPMRTTLTGFAEAKKAYENGTDEVSFGGW